MSERPAEAVSDETVPSSGSDRARPGAPADGRSSGRDGRHGLLGRVLRRGGRPAEHAGGVADGGGAHDVHGARSRTGEVDADVALRRRRERFARRSATPGALRVAVVADDVVRQGLEHDCTLLALSPERWAEELDAFGPDLILVESGADDAGPWSGGLASGLGALRGLVAWGHDQDVTTAFWNTGDPVRYDRFLQVAGTFDLVLTVDVDRVPWYRARLGHDRVHLLPQAAQPAVHHPFATGGRTGAGRARTAVAVPTTDGWPRRRVAELATLVEGAAEVGKVALYVPPAGPDGSPQPGAPRLPADLEDVVVGALAPTEAVSAHGSYDVGLSVERLPSSQTALARAVPELAAQNLLVLSSRSHAVSLLLGPYVEVADSAEEARTWLDRVRSDDVLADRLRLTALREVVRRHTYADRIALLEARIAGVAPSEHRPRVVVVGRADDPAGVDTLAATVARQVGVDAELVVATDDHEVVARAASLGLGSVGRAELRRAAPDVLDPAADGVAVMVAADWYGDHHLLDLALGLRYSPADAVSKASARAADGRVVQAAAEETYRPTSSLAWRSALVRRRSLDPAGLVPLVDDPGARVPVPAGGAVVLDRFEHCLDGAALEAAARRPLEAHPRPGGVRSVPEIEDAVLRGTPVPDPVAVRDADELAGLLPAHDDVLAERTAAGLALTIATGEDSTYLVLRRGIDPRTQWPSGTVELLLDGVADTDVRVACFFKDARKKRITGSLAPLGTALEAAVPEDCTTVDVALRVGGTGTALLRRLWLGAPPRPEPVHVPRTSTLLLSPSYPSRENIYQYMYVHTRVLSYAARGVDVDVVVPTRGHRAVERSTFEGIEVVHAGIERLRPTLASGAVGRVVVHALKEPTWAVLRAAPEHVPIYVWVHGAEMQQWWRRDFLYTTDEQRDEARARGERRTAFWRALVDTADERVHLVLVSQHFADEAQRDLERTFPSSRCTVIHNPIDTDLFAYVEKDPAQRTRILSIRPYASTVYANDLAVQAVLALADEPFFDELEFTFVGDGPLFDETLEPLRAFANVTLRQGFVTRDEIARLHRDHGVFLCPTRQDTQGVSRDEAMSSGLVPVTSGVTAVPEFVDDESGFLAPFEDHTALADAIRRLYAEPDLFRSMSRAAAARVRRQSAASRVIAQDLELLFPGGVPTTG